MGSTALSAQLDPEDYRAVVQQYQQTCTEVMQRHEGYLAQYLGDGLLAYFGYPTAHEDDARRAVRTGLEMVEAMRGQEGQQPLQVRNGIHTGLVVVGEIGVGSRTEQLALGAVPLTSDDFAHLPSRLSLYALRRGPINQVPLSPEIPPKHLPANPFTVYNPYGGLL